MPPKGTLRTRSVGFTVSDMAQSLDFFTKHFPFKKISDQTISAGADIEQLTGLTDISMRVVDLQLGNEVLELTAYSSAGQPIPTDTRSNDRWFQHLAIVVSDIDKAYAQLQQHNVCNVSPEPQTMPQSNPDMAGIRAFYFQDPDGHFLELIQFPPNKGDDKWHQTGDELFLGIDHTAVVVANTADSLDFYQNVIGLKLQGSMENSGKEHERLSQVPGIHIKITRLNPDQGIGVELLEYLSPQDGRPIPDDRRPNDVMHWQTTLVVEDVTAYTKESVQHPVSSGVSALPKESPLYDRGILVRDPDGHALRLIEKA